MKKLLLCALLSFPCFTMDQHITLNLNGDSDPSAVEQSLFYINCKKLYLFIEALGYSYAATSNSDNDAVEIYLFYKDSLEPIHMDEYKKLIEYWTSLSPLNKAEFNKFYMV